MLELEEAWHRLRLYEARVRGQQTKSSAWDESEALGIPANMRRTREMSERELKDTLCKAYMNMPWISSCIDARVLRMVSGTWELVPTCDDADESVRDQILELLEYINEDEDLMQLLYSYGLDVMIYGEAYLEIVRGGNGKPADTPTQLHKVDCQTMTYKLDERGQITGYEQNLEHSTKPIPLTPDQIMRTWFPSPESNKKPLSPVLKLMGAAMLYEQMMDWGRKFFKKGARPPFSFKHPGDRRKAEDFLLWLKENFTGPQNAHVPLLTYDGVETQYAPKGPVELDFLKGLEWVRQEVLSNMQTPPANVAVIESGNIGGGTGDSQQKTFVNNAVKPLDRLIMEKFNYCIVQKGFKTKQWKLVLHYASYEDDSKTSEIQDRKIRNGSLTVNEARKQSDNPPYEGYGDTPMLVAGNTTTPIPRLEDLEEEQRASAQIDIQTKQAQSDLAKTQAKKAKEPSQPVPAALQQAAPSANGQPLPPGQQQQKGPGNGKEQQAEALVAAGQEPSITGQNTQQDLGLAGALRAASDLSLREHRLLEQQHTGVMIAFMLDEATASHLALPGGEPATDLHVTLAVLGEQSELQVDPALLASALAAFAQEVEPLAGTIGGVGRFTPSDSSEGTSPVIALVNVPGIQQWRADLVQRLESLGVPVAKDFEYTPHITLAYVDADAPMPVESVPTLDLRFETLCLVMGDKRTFFPIGKMPVLSL
jgi:2'-5' RNA ligase/phage portal protein BeeE